MRGWDGAVDHTLRRRAPARLEAPPCAGFGERPDDGRDLHGRILDRFASAKELAVVLLDHGEVGEIHSVVDRAAHPDGVLLELSPTRQRLARVEQVDLGSGQIGPAASTRRNPRQMREPVEQGALDREKGENRPFGCENGIARRDASPLRSERDDLGRAELDSARVDVERDARRRPAAEDPLGLCRDHAGGRVLDTRSEQDPRREVVRGLILFQRIHEERLEAVRDRRPRPEAIVITGHGVGTSQRCGPRIIDEPEPYREPSSPWPGRPSRNVSRGG